MRTFAISDSKNIKSVGYDRGTQKLQVIFYSDETVMYTYENVKPLVFLDLITADSVGEFFAKSIRPHAKTYPFTKSAAPNLSQAHADKLEEQLKKSLKPSSLVMTPQGRVHTKEK